MPSLFNSTLSQPSSGIQNHPVGFTMTGHLTPSDAVASSSIPPFFRFRPRFEKVEWRRINAIDIEQMVRELDLKILQEHINAVTFCKIDDERCYCCNNPVDPCLVKLFRLAQYTLEYLHHSQECLQMSLQAAEVKLLAEAQEKEQLRVQMQHKTQQAQVLKEKAEQMKSIIAQLNGKSYQCQYCEKVFSSFPYLQNHMQRRHLTEIQKLMTDNQKNIQTMLQDEVNKLQGQLTVITSQMERQKDYIDKQEKELSQIQDDFKRQLETWKNDEKLKMNNKIDDVKQACQLSMVEINQRNRNLENELQKMQEKNLRESTHLPLTQPNTPPSSEHWQEVLKLQDKLHKQEVKWSGKIQKMKEEHDNEKSLLEQELSKLCLSVSESREESRRQVQDLSHKLQEQQQIINSQNKQLKKIASKPSQLTVLRDTPIVIPVPETKIEAVVRDQSTSVHRLDPIVELSEEDQDSPSITETRPMSRFKQKDIAELLTNQDLKRDIGLDVQQTLEERLFGLGCKGTNSVSRSVYESAMMQMEAERQKKCPVFWKSHKEVKQKLDQRVKKITGQPPKAKSQEHVQSRPRSRSFSPNVTRVICDPVLKHLQTPQPAPRRRTSSMPMTSTPLKPQYKHSYSVDAREELTLPFTSDEEYVDYEGDTDSESPKVLKKSYPINHLEVKAKASPTHRPASQTRTPVISTNRTSVTALSKSDSEASESSDMDETEPSMRIEHSGQNRQLDNTTHSQSSVKALGQSLEKKLSQSVKKPVGGVNMFIRMPTADSAKNKPKYADEEDEGDNLDSSLEEVSPTLITKSQDSTEIRKWGSSTGKGPRPPQGMTDADLGNTLNSSLTVTDLDEQQ